MGGMVDWDDPTQLPNGVAILAQNMAFQAESVRVRDGLRHTMTAAFHGDITGLDVLRVLNAGVDWTSVIFCSDGTLLTENPPGSGTLTVIPGGDILGGLSFPANANMLTAKAFNRIYMAFSDLKKGLGTPAVMDGPSGNVSPISQNPIGMDWTPGTFVRVGDLIKPKTANGRWFRCTTGGIMQNAEPVWPTLDGYFSTGGFVAPTDTDGVTSWEEWTPAAPMNIPVPPTPDSVTNNPGSGTIAAGQDVYIRLAYTFKNTLGSTTQWSPAIVFANTGANDELTINFETPGQNPFTIQGGPRMPRWLTQVLSNGGTVFPLFPVKLQIWVAAVAHGSAAPTNYGQFITGFLSVPDVPVAINSIPAPTQIAPGPTVVCPLSLGSAIGKPTIFKGETGIRQMILLRYDLNGQPSPVDPGSPIPVQFVNGGTQPVLFFPPGGTTDSLDTAAFTVVAGDTAGPYFFIDEPDPANPFVTGVVSIARAAGTVTAVLKDVSGLASGDVITVALGLIGDTSFDGEVTLATVDYDTNTATWPQTGLPDDSPAGPFPAATVILQQTLPTQAPAGTVAIALNFDDTFLASSESNDVTEQLNCIALPECVDIAYLPSVQRMVYTSDTEPTGLIFSDPNFPGVIDGENAILNIEISNGGIVVGARESRNGQIIAFKSNGGYAVTPTADVAANWGVNRLWGDHGPASGAGIGKTRDGSSGPSFMVFADPQTGLWKYPGTTGVIDWLTMELKSRRPGTLSTWDRVNRNAAEQIWVVVDEDQKEIKVGVPLDGATTPSHILTMNYVNGWDPPLMMTMTGDWIESRTSRRWSLDPIPTRCAQVVDRDLVTLIDPRLDTRQVLFGRPGVNPTGSFVDLQQPNVYDDNGAGIDAHYKPAFVKDPAGRKLLFVGFTGRAIGNGQIVVTPSTGDPDFDPELPTKTIDLGTGTKVVDFAKSLKIPKPRCTLDFSNGAVAGNWFALHEVVIYYRPIGVAAK